MSTATASLAANPATAPTRRRSSTASRATAESARVRRPRPRTSTEEREQPQLYVVRGLAPARSTLPFLFLVILILAGTLVTSMVLNARMADTAYRMQAAQVELNVVNDHINTVQAEVLQASAPDQLESRAQELGMVPAQGPGVVDLTTSSLSGGTAAWPK